MKKSSTPDFYKDASNAAERKGVDRREFLRYALTLGVTIPVASAIWSGRSYAQTPQKGGTFRVGLSDSNTTDNLDPGIAISMYIIQLFYASRSYLTEITAQNKLGPDAAQSWEATPDAKQWRFTLYPGQTFHNGKSLTAKDVVASMNFHRAETGGSSGSGGKSMLADVEDITTDGDRVVVFTLSRGNADLPYILSDYHLPIMPADESGKVDWSSGIGAGPYKIENFQPGVIAELTRHDGYHRENQAFFDSLKLMGINDVTARQTALMTGSIDAINTVDLKTIKLLKGNPNLIIDEVPGGTHGGMPMNCTVAPFNDPDVRKAMKYAINREEVVSKILSGHGVVGNDQPISPVTPYYADNIPAKTYDPDKAKFHLKKAGHENLGVALSTSTAAFGEAIDMGVLYRENAAAAGIDLEVVREPADGYWSNVWMKKPFVVVNTGQRPTPDMMFSLCYANDAAWNDTKWDNARFQELLVQAKGELDDAKRSAMYAEMQMLCSEDGGTVIPFFANKVGARSKKVAHADDISSAWDMDGGRAYQRWWFQS